MRRAVCPSQLGGWATLARPSATDGPRGQGCALGRRQRRHLTPLARRRQEAARVNDSTGAAPADEAEAAALCASAATDGTAAAGAALRTAALRAAALRAAAAAVPGGVVVAQSGVGRALAGGAALSARRRARVARAPRQRIAHGVPHAA